MKAEKIKKTVKTSSNLIVGGFIFWITETVFFQIRDGWHWHSSCQLETYCDNLVVLIYQIGLITLMTAVYGFFDNLFYHDGKE